MRKKSIFYISYGVASALVIWSLQELFLYLFGEISFIPKEVTIALFGALTGGLFGLLMVMMEGFFNGSKYLVNRGLRVGGIFGLLAGTISFFLTSQITFIEATAISDDVIYILLNSLRWLVIAVSVGIALGIRDENSLSTTRGVIAGLITGVVGGIAVSVMAFYIQSPMISRGLGLLVLTILFTFSIFRFSHFGRKIWLKTLNGNLEGMDLELSKEIHIFGTQDNNDINLQDYQEVQQSHAKLIRYFDNYSLVDNDPFCQTFVNFRVVKEQFLKNGDIIKIGTALFQYCTVN